MRKKKEQFEKMMEISAKYSLYVNYLSGKTSYVLAMEDHKEREETIKYIGKIYKAFMSLNDEEKEVINNEFLLIKGCQWWIEKYSEAEYKLLLFSSMSHFLKEFEKE